MALLVPAERARARRGPRFLLRPVPTTARQRPFVSAEQLRAPADRRLALAAAAPVRAASAPGSASATRSIAVGLTAAQPLVRGVAGVEVTIVQNIAVVLRRRLHAAHHPPDAHHPGHADQRRRQLLALGDFLDVDVGLPRSILIRWAAARSRSAARSFPPSGWGRSASAIVASATARQGTAGFGAPAHFVARQSVGARLRGGARRRSWRGWGRGASARRRRSSFSPRWPSRWRCSSRASACAPRGRRRWIHLGPLSGGPAPLLTAPWRCSSRGGPRPGRAAPARPPARWLAVLALVVEPDFSAAAIALRGGVRALAGGGVAGGASLPAAGLLLSRSRSAPRASATSTTGSAAFCRPESDRRGKGFEVLALARANAAGAARGVGLGHGSARHRLSSPGSDYAFAVVSEELGPPGALGVVAAWLAIGAGVVLAARSPRRRRDPRARALCGRARHRARSRPPRCTSPSAGAGCRSSA